MSSYNLIPFTDLSAVAFTTIVTTTTATVDGDVIILDGAKALAFRGLTSGSGPTPMYSWANESRGSGMWFATTGAGITTGLSFSLNGTTVAFFRVRLTEADLGFPGSDTRIAVSGGNLMSFRSVNNFESLYASSYRTTNGGGGEGGLHSGSIGANATGFSAFSFPTTANDLLIKVSTTNVGVATAVGGFWDGITGLYSTRPGFLQYATTTMTATTARPGAHITNLLSGATTLFVTLPSSVAGFEHTITNAQATAQTVVISPRAAGDRLSVFGLTKANGASVAANAPFSTITFHCITSTRWVATKLVGAWV